METYNSILDHKNPAAGLYRRHVESQAYGCIGCKHGEGSSFIGLDIAEDKPKKENNISDSIDRRGWLGRGTTYEEWMKPANDNSSAEMREFAKEWSICWFLNGRDVIAPIRSDSHPFFRSILVQSPVC